MFKKISFLSLCLLVGNLNCADRAAACRDKVPTCLRITTIAALTVLSIPSSHDCCSVKMRPVQNASNAEDIMNNARELTKKVYHWFGNEAKFRAAYPDWRPEYGDICQTVASSNATPDRTIVCHNSPAGVEYCIAKVMKDYLVVRDKAMVIAPAAFAKRMKSIEVKCAACTKQKVFRYNPGKRKDDYRRKNGTR